MKVRMRTRNCALIALIAFLTAGVAACGRVLTPGKPDVTSGVPTQAGQVEAGPYDVIELPLDAVPGPSLEAVSNPEFQDPESGAFVQVLRVLHDPRQIPLDRWLYSHPTGGETVVHPDANLLRDRLTEEGYSALAVYVKVRAPGEGQARDPFFLPRVSDDNRFGAWPALEVAYPETGDGLPCAPLDYAAGREAYQAPDTGRVFDPMAFTPPQPWYDPENRILPTGEIREGWLLCLSADIEVDEARLTWRTIPTENEIEQVITAWMSLHRLPVGDWHLIPDKTVLAWNEDEEDETGPGAGPAPPPGVAPTATSAVPTGGSEVVYQGPVWVSVGIGMSHERATTVTVPGSAIPADTLGSPAPGECAGVGVWYRYQEPYRVVCQPNKGDRFGRFFLQFSFPGMEELNTDWDRMALAERLSLNLYMQSDLDGLFTSFPGVELQSEATWIRADLPDGISTAWVAMSSGDWIGSVPVWQVNLYDAAFGSTSTDEICDEKDCLNVDDLAMDAADQEELRLKMPIPLLDLGEYGYGITVRRTWTTNQTVLVNDNLHGQDFLPLQRTDPWLFVEIATVTDRAGDMYILYPDGSGSFTLEPLEMVALYTNHTGNLAVRYAVHAEVRTADEGFALMGTLPRDVSLADVILVMVNTGPAWRLQ
jgi:hypothetical protein